MLSPLAAAGCTTTPKESAPQLAMNASYDLALPETVSVLPASYAAADATTPAASTLVAEAALPKPAKTAPESPAATTENALPAPAKPGETMVAEAALPAPTKAAEVAPAAESLVAEVAFKPSAFAKANGPRGEIDVLIEKYAVLYEVPVDLVRRVVKRESTFNPKAYNRGHWGLMQIKHATARGMGYDGPAKGLLDAETNLKYAVKYLRGAWMVSDGNADRADKLYQRGYYFDAKRKGLLDETGLGRDRVRRRL